MINIKRITTFIFILLFLGGILLIVYPFLPRIYYHFFIKGKDFYPYETKLQNEASNINKTSSDLIKKNLFSDKPIPLDNRLVIPSIKLDMPILEGNNENILNLGLWRKPFSGVPGQGNIVITGHRIGYKFLPEDIKNSTSLYNLDKVNNGEYIIIYWNKTEYDYKIVNHSIVEATDVSIENQSSEEKLTLYTCDPIGENKHRLVYYALPILEE